MISITQKSTPTRIGRWLVIPIALLGSLHMHRAEGQTNDNSFSTESSSRPSLPVPQYSIPSPTSTRTAAGTEPALPAFAPVQRQSNSASQSTRTLESGDIAVDYCSIEFIDDIKLPALEPGSIRSINVEEGQFIPAGTIVGQIDDSVPQMELESAKLRYSMAFDLAEDKTSVVAAKKELALARAIYEKNRRLAKRGSRASSEVEESRFQKEIAELKSTKASNDRLHAYSEAKVELATLEAFKMRIARHTMRSDYDAYVVEVFKKPQEFANVGDDVMRLARMDEMWVRASLNARVLDASEAENRPVTVTLKTSTGEEKFQGKIDQVSLEFVSGEEYGVKIKVKNRQQGNSWLLRPFSRVSMVIHISQPAIADSKKAAQPGRRVTVGL